MFWPFKRKPKPIIREWFGPTETDWKIGDVAECIVPQDFWVENPTAFFPILPVLNNRYFVTNVKRIDCINPHYKCFGLTLLGLPCTYGVVGFRKIVLTDDGMDRKVKKEQPILQEV